MAATTPIVVMELQSTPGSHVNRSTPVEVVADFDGHLILEGHVEEMRGIDPGSVNFDMGLMSGQTPVQYLNFTLDRVWQTKEPRNTELWRVVLTDAPFQLKAGRPYEFYAQVLVLGSKANGDAAVQPLTFRLYLQPSNQ